MEHGMGQKFKNIPRIRLSLACAYKVKNIHVELKKLFL